jgi:hypothetical protein
MEAWEAASERQFGLFPPSLFFSDEDIKMILDYFALLTSLERVAALISHNPRLNGQQTVVALYGVICKLQIVFNAMAVAKREKAREKRRAEKESAASMHDPESTDMESTNDEGNPGDADIPPLNTAQSGIKWRLDLR